MGVMNNVTGIVSKTQKVARRPIGNNKNTSRPMTTIFRTDRPWVFETRFFLESSTRDLPVPENVKSIRLHAISARNFGGP